MKRAGGQSDSGMNIKGLTVKKVLVDEAADIAAEIYLGIVIDRSKRRPVVMASSEGGVEIEEVARTKPERIVKIAITFPGLAAVPGPGAGVRNWAAQDCRAISSRSPKGCTALYWLRCLAG